MDKIHLRASFQNSVRGYRRINTARKHGQDISLRTHRQSPGTGDPPRVDIGVLARDFNEKSFLRIRQVYSNTGLLMKCAPDFAAHFNRSHGKLFVAARGGDSKSLESPCLRKRKRRLLNGCQSRGNCARPGMEIPKTYFSRCGVAGIFNNNRLSRSRMRFRGMPVIAAMFSTSVRSNMPRFFPLARAHDNERTTSFIKIRRLPLSSPVQAFSVPTLEDSGNSSFGVDKNSQRDRAITSHVPFFGRRVIFKVRILFWKIHSSISFLALSVCSVEKYAPQASASFRFVAPVGFPSDRANLRRMTRTMKRKRKPQRGFPHSPGKLFCASAITHAKCGDGRLDCQRPRVELNRLERWRENRLDDYAI